MPCGSVFSRFLVETAILVEMAMHGQTRPYMAMAIYGHPWPCMAMHGHAWPDMAMYGHVWPDMAIISSKRHSKSKNRIFLSVRKIARKSGKPGFHVFWLFTLLFGRFRLSRVFQTTGVEEIYRFI